MSAGAALPQIAPAGLAQGLRQVMRRAVGLSESDRRRVVEVYLAYQLREVPRPRVPALLRHVQEQLEPGRCAGPQVAPVHEAPGAGGSSRAAATTSVAEHTLTALVARLRALGGDAADPLAEPEVLLDRVQARAEAVDRAVQRTAQEFFDRVLQALDPDAARAFVGKPGLRPAPLYKAAVFDAYAEKFGQLAEYHRKGRLVRDFRASFKRNLRA